MRIVPDSTVTLYEDIPIAKGKTLAFQSLQAQTTYFNSKALITKANCQMVKRRRGWLRIQANAAQVARCNYISFENPSFDNKRFYAMITDYDYINNECVEITYAIDNLQSWLFDFQMYDTYIEREHLSIWDKDMEDTNPYNPDILELKTVESIPITPDMEKPNYTLSNSTISGDGIMVAREVTNNWGTSNSMGVLITISQLALANLDDDANKEGRTAPSNALKEFINDMVSDDTTTANASFMAIGHQEWTYLQQEYPGQLPNIPHGIWTGGLWNSKVPALSKVSAPVSYFYIDGAGDNPYNNYNATQRLAQLLSFLTTSNSTDSIVGIYAIPDSLMLLAGITDSQNFGGWVVQLTPPSVVMNVRNKKLCTYPFSYYRMIAPNGDVKELKFEDFESVQNDENPDYTEVAIGMDFYSSPSLICAPKGYKINGLTDSINYDTNPTEGLIFNQFAVMPYAIDAYMAHAAAVANTIIANNTVDYSYQVEQEALDVYKGRYGAIAKVATSFGSLITGKGSVSEFGNTLMEGIFSGAQSDINAERNGNEWAQSTDAYYSLGGYSPDNAVHKNLQYTKPAYCCNQYHFNNSAGDINYSKFSFLDIVLLRVSLNPKIQEQIDTYFDNFGYTSGRFGTPHIMWFLHGSSDVELLPSWHEVNNMGITYVKTSDCKVTGVMLPVAQAIQETFNAGIQFIDPSYTPPSQGGEVYS